MPDSAKPWLKPVPPSLHGAYRWFGVVFVACLVSYVLIGIYWLVCYLFDFRVREWTVVAGMLAIGVRFASTRLFAWKVDREERRINDSQSHPAQSSSL